MIPITWKACRLAPTNPRYSEQPAASVELVEVVLRLRETYPRWGKDKLVVLLQRKGFDCSASMVGGILRSLRIKERFMSQYRTISQPAKGGERDHIRSGKPEYLAATREDIVEVIHSLIYQTQPGSA